MFCTPPLRGVPGGEFSLMPDKEVFGNKNDFCAVSRSEEGSLDGDRSC